MFNVFRREMRANLKAVIIWGAAMFAFSAVGFGEYAVVTGGETPMDFDKMINIMPRLVQLMMGMGKYEPGTSEIISVSTAQGWYICMFLWCGLVAYIHAALLGADILSKEERDKTAEFLYTKPIKRSEAVCGKMAAAVLNSFFVVFVCWAGAVLTFLAQLKDVSVINAGSITLSMFGMFLTAQVFMFLGILLSTVLRGRGKALTASVWAVAVFYALGVAFEAYNLPVRAVTPMMWFDSARVIYVGFEPLYAALAVAVSVLAGFLSVKVYGARELN
ncbi:MAG: ABC transporter permease [Oscillospiraceae bacterium]|jgi:ABC-2 type transport system permease protein|nr:ABC transporter permease [Oscillospiraceae bacterium]